MSKTKYKEDDGRTIYDMSNVQTKKFKIDKSNPLNVSKKEKNAMIKALFETYLPMFIVFILSFILVGFLLYLWLK